KLPDAGVCDTQQASKINFLHDAKGSGHMAMGKRFLRNNGIFSRRQGFSSGKQDRQPTNDARWQFAQVGNRFPDNLLAFLLRQKTPFWR
ncbi:hypothetical protein LJC22_00835, partial [Desulfosarcina sp. OttesenSCG-928-G10]|nr:hypothetical protein [Desulfosarcina sp. OttesenSCG-928-G10]